MLVNPTQTGFSAIGNSLLLDPPNMFSILGVRSEVLFPLPSAVYLGYKTAFAVRKWDKFMLFFSPKERLLLLEVHFLLA